MRYEYEDIKNMLFEKQCDLLQELEHLTDEEIDLIPSWEVERLLIELHCNRGR